MADLQAISGRTWSGIEYGEAPQYAYSFFQARVCQRARQVEVMEAEQAYRCTPAQYVDAVRRGDLTEFKTIEAETADWWFPTLDRGAGAALHIAADHGQVRVCVLRHSYVYLLPCGK